MHLPEFEIAVSSRIKVMSRIVFCVLLAAGSASVGFVGSAQAVPTRQAAFLQSQAQSSNVLYTLALPNGRSAVVYKNGLAYIFTSNFNAFEVRRINELAGNAQNPLLVPTKAQVWTQLAKAPPRAYAPGKVLVVYRDGVSGASDSINVSASKLVALRQIRSLSGSISASQAPRYTTSASMNVLLADLGVDRSTRLFSKMGKAQLRAMSERAKVVSGHNVLNIGNAYELHLVGTSVEKAVMALRRSGQVAYASPAFYVTTMHTHPVPFQRSRGNSRVREQTSSTVGSAAGTSDLPSNYGLQSSLQSMFNSPSLNAAAAYDIIKRRFGQLPGEGQIITNVSLGDLTDKSTPGPSGLCAEYANSSLFGPTTVIQGGQRYLNWPSMPLIPTWTVDLNGNLDALGTVCGVDSGDYEIGLDFSVMAPLPHDQQRPGEEGSGISDLLGIAPGADYRLVVPASMTPTTADSDAALLAAANQSPPPDIITASIGLAFDSLGFPGRFLEDDPLSRSIIASIVSNNIVVTIASNDGLRTMTHAAVSPSGGAAPTEVANDGDATDINDIFDSTMPSRDPDTGSFAVGGTTLDDISAAPPQDPANAALKAQHAFAETRWTGFANFASGFGSRVNVSAPADNIVAFFHQNGGEADDVSLGLEGGTSASAPEVAAAVAVVEQVARLTGQSFPDPKAVRDFLVQTGTPVPKVPQSDVHNHVGPQINLGRAVETLLTRAGNPVNPQVAGVAIEQRRTVFGGTFQSNTDPDAIDLSKTNGSAWITMAPNWEGLPDGTTYQLRVETASGSGAASADGVLAGTPWARVRPAEIFRAAGAAATSSGSRTFNFVYTAAPPGASSVEAHFKLTFGPNTDDRVRIPAPVVQSVVRGATMIVHYDLTHTGLSQATLVVSQPARIPWTGPVILWPTYETPISGAGMLSIPVSSLQGGGIYTLFIQRPQGVTNVGQSNNAYTLVQPEASSARPPAPQLSANGSAPSYRLEIPYKGDATIAWDVSNVPGATGAILEISAPGPSGFGQYAMFNNPNGSKIDHNGHDTGSRYSKFLSGVSGTITLKGSDLVHMLVPTLYESVRVLPVSGATVIGEASEISTLQMDGIMPEVGNSVYNGYAINPDGRDGFLTSKGVTASGQTVSSLETFDQITGAITQVVRSETGHVFVTSGGANVFPSDVGLFGLADPYGNNPVYQKLDPVADGTLGANWTAPVQVAYAAANDANQVGMFLGLQGQTNAGYRVFTSNISTGTFSPLYDVSNPFTAFGTFGLLNSIAENTNTNTGLLVGGNAIAPCTNPTPPVFVTMDLETGKLLKTMNGDSRSGFGLDVAWDSKTNKALATTWCPVNHLADLYDGNTGSITGIELNSGGIGGDVAADTEHGLFLVMEPNGAVSNALLDNNGISGVEVLDENGNHLRSYERFNLYATLMPYGHNSLKLNTAHGMAYMYDLGQAQIQPFNYMSSELVASDGTLTTEENESASGMLKATTASTSSLVFSVVEEPQHGRITINDAGTGAYTYTPDQDYVGSDSFDFKASDGKVDSNTATVRIAVNEAVNQPPTASDGDLTTNENSARNGTLQASDPDGDPLTFSIVDQPLHGNVTLDDAKSGAYTYTPNKGYSGSDSFTFKANDGRVDSNVATVSITVKAAGNAPTASDGHISTDENQSVNGTLQAGDPDSNPLTFSIVDQPLHGSVTLRDMTTGAYTYTPNQDYVGDDSFTFRVNNGQADSNVATVSVTVDAVNPTPHPDSGGGAFGWLTLAGLIGLMVPALLRRRSKLSD